MSDDRSLIAFKAISNFVNDLSSEYGKKNRSLKLYQRLINKTKISHEKAINKHLNIFKSFSEKNRNAIVEQNVSKLVSTRISYSKNVFINLENIFKIADDDTKNVIWQHILTISAILDPAGKAKQVLKKSYESGMGGKNEADFLSNMFSNLQQNMEGSSESPMNPEMINNMFTGIQQGMQSGELNMGKFIGSIQGMLQNLQNEIGDDDQMAPLLNSMSKITSNMDPNNPNGTPPDISGMMGMVTGLMGSLVNGGGMPSAGPSHHSDDNNNETLLVEENNDPSSHNNESDELD